MRDEKEIRLLKDYLHDNPRYDYPDGIEVRDLLSWIFGCSDDQFDLLVRVQEEKELIRNVEYSLVKSGHIEVVVSGATHASITK